jgi:hypothetical protein
MSRKKKAETAIEPKRITIATEREAKELTESLRNEFKKSGWFELGKRVKDCLDRQVPYVYGLLTDGKPMNVAPWMELCFEESVPTVYAAYRMFRGLEPIGDPRVPLISRVNAENLVRLPEDLRLSPEWLQKALEMPTGEFKAAVDDARAARGAAPKEKWVAFFPKLPATLRELYEAVEKKLAEAMDLDLELHPERRFQIWERVIVMLFQTGEENLRAALVGDDGSAPPAVPE